METVNLMLGGASLAIILCTVPLGLLLIVALYRGAFDSDDPRIRRGWYADSDDVVAPAVYVWRWARRLAARVAGWLW